MPLHRVNASDAENFDTLGVTGLTLSGSVQISNGSRNQSRNNDAALRGSFASSVAGTYDNGNYEGNRGVAPHESPNSNAINCGHNLLNNSNNSRPRGSESSSSDVHETRFSFSSVGSSSWNNHVGRNTFNSRHGPIYEDEDHVHSSETLTSENDFHDSYSKQNGRGQQGFIPEEDETQSLSTMDDSFSVSQQQSYYQSRPSFQLNKSESQQLLQQKNNRFRHSRVKAEGDTSSVTSSTGGRSQESVYSSQLESRVTKLSLELATTKASLDELQLEHRRVKNEKDELKLVISALEGENEQLHKLVEKLEKEKLLMSIEKTVGVAHSTELRGSLKKEDSTFKVSTFRAEPRGPATKKKIRHHKSRSKSKSGDELEVPFRNKGDDPSVDTKRSFQSTQSDADYSVCSSAGDGMSVGALSLHSIGDIEHVTKLLKEGALGNLSDSDKEGYDDSDPFSTWSTPEDRAKQSNKQKNWFQRGVEALNQPHKATGDSDEMNGDPFDTCSRSGLSGPSGGVYSDPIKHIFADDSTEPIQQERKGGGFQLFRGLRGNRNQN